MTIHVDAAEVPGVACFGVVFLDTDGGECGRGDARVDPAGADEVELVAICRAVLMARRLDLPAFTLCCDNVVAVRIFWGGRLKAGRQDDLLAEARAALRHWRLRPARAVRLIPRETNAAHGIARDRLNAERLKG